MNCIVRPLATYVATVILVSAAQADLFGNLTPFVIPDNVPSGVTSTIAVSAPAGAVVRSVRVYVAFGAPTHPFAGDLHAELVAPGGRVVHLFSRLGSTTPTGTGDNSDLGGLYEFTSDPSAASLPAAAAVAGPTDITPPGTYATSTHAVIGGQPAGRNLATLDDFFGDPASGNWTLRISDNKAGDVGGVQLWLLDLDFFSVVVTNLNDAATPPAGSLRKAIADAAANPGPDAILISPELSGTIQLTSALNVVGPLEIRGPGPDRVAISGQNASRVFNISGVESVEIAGLEIRNGRAPGGTGSQGGGLIISGTPVVMRDCAVRECVANGVTAANGGGIYSTGSSLALIHCRVSGNSATAGTAAFGGGVYLSAGTLTLANSSFSSNSVTANTTTEGGGAYAGASFEVTNCTFHGNQTSGVAPRGAAISGLGSGVLRHCTIVGNAPGPAVRLAPPSSVALQLINTLASGNNGANFQFSNVTVTSGGGNVISDGSSGLVNGVNNDRIGVDPLVASFDEYGGLAGPVVGLLPGSPAIDNGVPTAERTDGRGFPRSVDGNCDLVATPDSGAFEYNAGRGLHFDGGTDHVALSPNLLPTAGLTIEAWVRAESSAAIDGVMRVVSNRSESGGIGFGQSGGRLLFTTFLRQDVLTNGRYIEPGDARHIAVVFTGTQAQFYVDGVQVEVRSANGPSLVSPVAYFIGRNPTNQSLEPWVGQIDDVRIWTIARTPAQIAADYAAVLEPPIPGLIGYWKFDDGAGAALNAVNGVGFPVNGAARVEGETCGCTDVRGDSDCSGAVDFFDIDCFVAALSGATSWQACAGSGGCDYLCVNDIDENGVVDFFDIDPFVACLSGNCP